MKKLVLSLAIVASIFTSCSDDDSNNNGGGTTEEVLSGDITADRSLNANTIYTLQGPVYVKPGVTLTIPAGTHIEADVNSDEVSVLAIEKGAKLIAQGTAANPIVFTSNADAPAPGDWGGIVVCGNSLTNLGVNVQAEVTGLTYGGTNAADNSGVLSYIVVEYAGALINENAEFNGFAFYAVGSGTVVNNLYAFQGSDDAFEWFGGTVNATNLVSVGNQDDSFDWTEGWSGTVTNLYSDQSSALTFSADSRGIEADSNQADPTKAPISNPTLSNITLIGRNNAAVTSEAGIMLRRGTQGKINNVFIQNFIGTTGSYGVNFNGAETQAWFALNPVTNVQFSGVPAATEANVLTSIVKGTATGAGNGAALPTWADWTK